MCEKWKKNKKKKSKKLSQFLKPHISGTLEAISLKFGMWSTEVGVILIHQGSTEVRKLRFCSSCQYTHGCCAPASWADLCYRPLSYKTELTFPDGLWLNGITVIENFLNLKPPLKIPRSTTGLVEEKMKH